MEEGKPGGGAGVAEDAMSRFSLDASAGGRHSTLLDEYERLAFEAQLNRAIVLRRCYSEPSPVRVMQPQHKPDGGDGARAAGVRSGSGRRGAAARRGRWEVLAAPRDVGSVAGGAEAGAPLAQERVGAPEEEGAGRGGRGAAPAADGAAAGAAARLPSLTNCSPASWFDVCIHPHSPTISTC